MSATLRPDPRNDLWSCTAKVLSVLIVFGVGWIFGFLVRWGIHTYYIDALGHCARSVLVKSRSR